MDLKGCQYFAKFGSLYNRPVLKPLAYPGKMTYCPAGQPVVPTVTD